MRMRPWIVVAVALSLSAGCRFNAPTGPKSSAAHPKPTTGQDTVLAGAHPIAALEAVRVIDAAAGLTGKVKLVAAELTGKVKLISDKGSGIISNNTGGLVSDHGGGIISGNTGNLVANNGGGLTGKVKLRVLAEGAAREENPLADADVEVLDGEGRLLVGADKKPLMTRTDATGAYHFTGQLPDENLVLRIRLFNGGQLFAVRPRGGEGAMAIDLDTASSLGTRYVLDRYVLKQQSVFDKLPGTEATALHAELDAARGLLDGVPSYQPADLVAAAEALRKKAPDVDKRFERIRAIMVAGLANNGEGLAATRVSLAAPFGIFGDAKGRLYIAESAAGRIREVAADGTIRRYAGGSSASRGAEGDEARKVSFDAPCGIVEGADGTVYVADYLAHRVRKITPDGKVYTVAGTSTKGHGATPAKGPDVDLNGPDALALGPDGTLYIAEDPSSTTFTGRVLHVLADGTLEEIPGPDWSTLGQTQAGQGLTGIAVGPDGAIWIVDVMSATIWRRSPEGAWTLMAKDLPLDNRAGITLDADGAAYFATDEGAADYVYRLRTGDVPERICGTGHSGFSGDGGPALAASLNNPAGVWMGPDHKLYVADSGNGLIRRIDLSLATPTIDTVAGTQGLTQQGNATSIAINSPSGLVVDPQGRLVVAEAGSHTIKRLQDGRLEVIAGSSIKGAGPENVPALQAQFDVPSGIGYDGGVLFVLEGSGCRLRRIGADGLVNTVAGVGRHSHLGEPSAPALEGGMGRPLGLAIGPDHNPYWTDNENNQVLRLRNGNMECVAGSLEQAEGDAGDGGPASAALLNRPFGLAFDPKGDLYFCDSGNMRVRRITGLDTDAPRIEAAVGMGGAETLGRLTDGTPVASDGAWADALLMGPSALCFDAAGNLYVAEIGSSKVQTLAATIGLPADAIPSIGARIRKFSTDGRFKTIAGDGGGLLNDPDHEQTLLSPLGMVIDAQGGLVIVDNADNQLKMLPPGSF